MARGKFIGSTNLLFGTETAAGRAGGGPARIPGLKFHGLISVGSARADLERLHSCTLSGL